MNPGLRKALLGWLLLPTAVAFLVFLPVAYHLLHRPAIDAFDQALADAGLALVPHLHVEDGREPRFSFPPAAEQVLRADRTDEIYYLILGPNGRFVAGDRGLPVHAAEDDDSGRERVAFDAYFRDRPIRVVALRQTVGGEPYLFIVAETTRKREALRFDLAVGLVLPLIFFVLATAFAIWFGLRLALAPVDEIRRALAQMEHGALAPLDEARAPHEIRPLVSEFNALLARLDAAGEAQRRFVANAAHQLRTPLAGVRTQLELLDSGDEAPARRERIGRCIGAIERLGHLVGQMLVLLSAAPGGRDGGEAARLDVQDVIRERSPEWIWLAEAQGLDLGFELAPAPVRADALLIGEMVGNLVDNALRYTPAGGAVTVRCGTGPDGQVGIEVEDDGPGIAPADRERVFERFLRLPDAQPIPGSGLGLAIVREIAQRFHGSVGIGDAAAGGGTRVAVCLPAAPPP